MIYFSLILYPPVLTLENTGKWSESSEMITPEVSTWSLTLVQIWSVSEIH